MNPNNTIKIFSCIRYETKEADGWKLKNTKGSPVEEQATQWLNANGLIPLNTDLDTSWVTEVDGKNRISVVNLVIAAIPQALYLEFLSSSFSALIELANKPEEEKSELPGVLAVGDQNG